MRILSVFIIFYQENTLFPFKKLRKTYFFLVEKIRKDVRKEVRKICVFLKKIIRTEKFLISSHHDTSRLPTFRKKETISIKKKAASELAIRVHLLDIIELISVVKVFHSIE